MPTEETTGKNPAQSKDGEQKPASTTTDVRNDEIEALVEDVEKADPAKTAHLIKKLRNEAEANRKAAAELKQLKEQQEAALKQQQEAAEKALAEQGQFKQLAEQRAADIERKDAKIAELTATVNALTVYRDFAVSALEKRKEAMPEALRKRVPDFGDPLKELQYIEENPDLFTPSRKAPDLNQGQGNSGGDADAASKREQIRAGFRRYVGR